MSKLTLSIFLLAAIVLFGLYLYRASKRPARKVFVQDIDPATGKAIGPERSAVIDTHTGEQLGGAPLEGVQVAPGVTR